MRAVLLVIGVLFLASCSGQDACSKDGVFEIASNGTTLWEIDNTNGTSSCNFSTPCDITATSFSVPGQGNLLAIIQNQTDVITALQNQVAALQTTIAALNASMVTGATSEYARFTLDRSGTKNGPFTTIRPGLGLTFTIATEGIFPSRSRRSIEEVQDIQPRGMSQPFLGSIHMFGGNFAPLGFALCDGTLLSISANSALFALLGTFYGGDGTSNFALPDLRGAVPIHVGQGIGLPAVSLGETV